MSDTDATQARQDVAVEVDEIIEHVINANMLSMPYDVYLELFDAVDGLGVEIENIHAENAKLRDLCEWLLEPYRLGAVTGEGVDRQWCRETYDGGSYRLRELGAEVPNA